MDYYGLLRITTGSGFFTEMAAHDTSHPGERPGERRRETLHSVQAFDASAPDTAAAAFHSALQG